MTFLFNIKNTWPCRRPLQFFITLVYHSSHVCIKYMDLDHFLKTISSIIKIIIPKIFVKFSRPVFGMDCICPWQNLNIHRLDLAT